MNLKSKFDPELLQARWVLGKMSADEVVEFAIRALEQNYDGTALRQLAGLNHPALRDLGALPDRAFVEMGLSRCSREMVISRLLDRESSLTSETVYTLVKSFPDFSERWREHLGNWGGEPAGSYNDMAEFVHFVVEDLYERNRVSEVQRAFDLLEGLLVEGDQSVRDLVGLGFFETLQNFSSWRPYGNTVFEKYLGPMSKRVWKEIRRNWAGKSSLMDVIRSERKSS